MVWNIFILSLAAKYRSVNKRRRFALFSPLPSIPSFQIRVWNSCPRPESALFPRVNSADFRRGGEGGGLGSPLAGISPNKEIRFFDDFSILI
jgi:hypothetical protein